MGQHEKITEKDLALTPIQMGARVYFPTLGRFAQVDPIEGGSENSYVYPPNPIVDFDLTGQWTIKGALSAIDSAVKSVGKYGEAIGMVATGVGVAACIAAVACGAALAGGAIVGAAMAGARTRYEGGSVVRSLGAVAVSGAIDIGFGKMINVARIVKAAPRTVGTVGHVLMGTLNNQLAQTAGAGIYKKTYNATSSAASRYTKSSNTLSLQSSPSSYTWGSAGSLQVRPLPYQGTLRVVNY